MPLQLTRVLKRILRSDAPEDQCGFWGVTSHVAPPALNRTPDSLLPALADAAVSIRVLAATMKITPVRVFTIHNPS